METRDTYYNNFPHLLCILKNIDNIFPIVKIQRRINYFNIVEKNDLTNRLF